MVFERTEGESKFETRRPRFFRFAGLILLSGLVALLLAGGDVPGGMKLAAAAGMQGEDVGPEQLDEVDAVKTEIRIDLTKPLAKIPGDAFGIWLGNSGHDRPDPAYLYRSPEGKNKFRELGAKNLFYSTDQDSWSNSYDAFNAVPRAYPDWMDSQEYINLNNELKSSPIIAANITHLCAQTDANLPPASENVTCRKTKASEAVNWIKYLKSINAPIKNVVLGMEPYAGCIYWNKGINCTDKAGRHRIALPQEEYAARVVQWAKKLKKANPNVRIGAHLQPNTYLCKNSRYIMESAGTLDAEEMELSSEAAAAACGNRSWDQTVMEVAGEYVDFFVVHQYFVIREHAKTEAAAQALSYYTGQINMRVNKNGLTAFPSQIRNELIQWLPAKKNAPIMVAEFNVSYIEKVSTEEMFQARQSLYTAMALGELLMDLLKPVATSEGRLNGASQAVLLGMFAPQLTLTRMEDPNDPNSMIYTPAWYVLSMLKPFPGKNIVQTKVVKNPKTAVNKNALSVTAVSKGKKVYVAVFNHDFKAVKTNIVLNGGTPVSVNVQQLGHTGSGFLSMNQPGAATTLAPEATTVPAQRFKKNAIKKFNFPAHSVTVLEIRVQ